MTASSCASVKRFGIRWLSDRDPQECAWETGAKTANLDAGAESRSEITSHANTERSRIKRRHSTAIVAWPKSERQGNVVGRWYDNRHTLVTELAESHAGDEVIMSIAGLVSRAMLSRYSHVRMEVKRSALDEIAARQCAADERRKEDADLKGQDALVSQSAVL